MSGNRRQNCWSYPILWVNPKLFVKIGIGANIFLFVSRIKQTNTSHIRGVQCDAISWKQIDKWHFSRGYNFWTNDFIVILKTPARPYSCLAKVVFWFRTCLNVMFISCMAYKKGPLSNCSDMIASHCIRGIVC